MMACHRVRVFPNHTSWREQKYLIKLELMKLRNNSLHLNVADVESAEFCIACYVQRSTYGTIYRELSADAERYHQIISNLKSLQLKQELRSLSPLCPLFVSLGLLHMQGRLSKINVSYDRKH